MRLSVDGFCCGYSLEQGSRTIANLGLAWGILALLGNAAFPYTAGGQLGEYYCCYLAAVVTHVVASGLLRYGVRTKNASYLIYWFAIVLAENVLTFGVSFVCARYAFYYRSYYQVSNQEEEKFALIYQGFLGSMAAYCLVFNVLAFYFMRVVLSYYKELKSDLEEGEEEEENSKED